jgi:hypothetical protein
MGVAHATPIAAAPTKQLFDDELPATPQDAPTTPATAYLTDASATFVRPYTAMTLGHAGFATDEPDPEPKEDPQSDNGS